MAPASLRTWSKNLPATGVPRAIVSYVAAALIVLTLLLCLLQMQKLPLIDLLDEGTYATAARNMLDSGDWITPRVGGSAFLEKPPLTFWCQAFFIKILGPVPLAARLPSALGALLTALALYLWSRKQGVARTGWMTAALYVLCPLVAIALGRLAMMDSLLTLWLTLALIGWIEGYHGNRNWYFLMAAGMGLAVMTKGLIGFVLPALTFSVWLIARRDFRALRQIPWVGVVGIFVLIALPWHLAAWRANGNLFAREYILHQQFARFLGRDFGHNRPFWYFVPALMVAMFPWSAFVPIAWWQNLRRVRNSAPGSLECKLAMWSVWAAVVFLFFSISFSKLPNYILPAVPALTLLSAWRISGLAQGNNRLASLESLLISLTAGVLGSVYFAAGVWGLNSRANPSLSWFAKWLGRVFNWKEGTESVEVLWHKLAPITDYAPYWFTLGALLLGASVIAFVFWRNALKTLPAVLLVNVSIIIVTVHLLMPAWGRDELAPPLTLSQIAAPALSRGEPLVVYAHPQRISLKYLLGYDRKIISSASPEFTLRALSDAGHGYYLTTTDVPLPDGATSFREVARNGKWVLWRYDPNPASNTSKP